MKTKIIALVSLCIVLVSIFSACSCSTLDYRTMGVWWWNSDLGTEYVDFAYNHGINEIYYCDSSFNDDTKNFIDYAKTKGMKVYYLAGEYQWIYDDTNLHNKIDKYLDYQENNPHSKFSGIHLDIEPHQASEWKSGDDSVKTSLVQKLVNLIDGIVTTYSDIEFHFDIPFWLDHEVVIDGYTKPAYEHIIDMADRVFIMSYRDTAQKIYEVAKDEIIYANSKDKSVVLGIETFSTEGDSVSFMEEGSDYMYEQIDKLKDMIPLNTGICIHHISTWYDMIKN